MNTQETQQIDPKILALAAHLECAPEEITESRWKSFERGSEEYLVLTDHEADERAKEYIKDTLWAFNASFLEGYMPDGVDEDTIKIIQEKCESANPAIIKLVCDNLDSLINDAIGCDGRGHFMSSYDGEEWEVTIDGVTYYIYRIN